MIASSTRIQGWHVQNRNLALVVVNVGPIFSWIAIIASLLTQVTTSSTNIGPIPAALALIALTLGIPHGAADNQHQNRKLSLGQVMSTKPGALPADEFLNGAVRLGFSL